MKIALAINLAMLAAAAIGGVLTGSLALLAEAGHVLSDVGAIVLALLAAALAARSGGPRRTFGYQRTEVIAALVNGVTLVAIAVLIVVAAINRLGDPPSVEGAGVIVLGVVELLGNGAATWILARGDREDLNLEAVLRHSAADAFGAIAVVVSGAVILATGWRAIDPLASIAIAALILASSIRLVREPLDVLMEAAPGRGRRRDRSLSRLHSRRQGGARAPCVDGHAGVRGARGPHRRGTGRGPRPGPARGGVSAR